MTTQISPFEWLQSFFQSNCDGEWEHEYGCTIETTSDPGWKLTFELRGTTYDSLNLEELEDRQGPMSWMKCKIEDSVFIAYSSPKRLAECITLLRDLVEGRR